VNEELRFFESFSDADDVPESSDSVKEILLV